VAPVAEPSAVPLRPRNRKRTTEEIAAIAEQIHRVAARTPWLSAAEISEALGITTTDLEIPLRLLTGRDARGKLTGDPSRLVTTGVKKATRYALLGTPPPKAQRKPR
jgi:hypothetical protein